MRQAKLETLSWLFTVVTLFGCGGGSSGGGGGAPTAAEATELCTKVCQKLSSCQGLTLDCASFCADNGPGKEAIPSSCNTRDVFNKVNACVDGTCSAVTSCISDATKQCDTGTGGSSGTGGTTSSGGSSSADCSVCTKASTCCAAIATQQGQDASQCASFSAATCTSAGSSQATVITACQGVLQTGVALNLEACK